MSEPEFIASLRVLAHDPAARGLLDDTAVLGDLVLTHDMIVEGVHFLPDDPPGDVAWKLVAVNLSDLAAKGANPVGCLLGYTLGAPEWNAAFVEALGEALVAFGMPLLGGDTVSGKGPRSFGLTAIGRSDRAPSRAGAKAGDALYVTGTIGDAGLGLRLLQQGRTEPAGAIAAYRRPVPRLAEGRALAPIVHAMMDISDGLLIDAARMAEASGLALDVQIDAVPLLPEVRSAMTPLETATAGDDYELLFAAPPGLALPVPATRIGTFAEGSGLTLSGADGPVPLPAHLGWLHR